MNERTFRAENALKLEDPDRHKWLPTAEVIGALDLRPGMNVVDIGAGTGYFSVPIAEAVGETGSVTAVDLQQGMLDFLREKIAKRGGPANIALVLGEAAKTTLPAATADLVLMANVWHEVDDRPAVLAEMKRLLLPGGVLAILDWRADREPPPGPPAGHRIASGGVGTDLTVEGWALSGTVNVGEYHYLVLSRPGR